MTDQEQILADSMKVLDLIDAAGNADIPTFMSIIDNTEPEPLIANLVAMILMVIQKSGEQVSTFTDAMRIVLPARAAAAQPIMDRINNGEHPRGVMLELMQKYGLL